MFIERNPQNTGDTTPDQTLFLPRQIGDVNGDKINDLIIGEFWQGFYDDIARNPKEYELHTAVIYGELLSGDAPFVSVDLTKAEKWGSTTGEGELDFSTPSVLADAGLKAAQANQYTEFESNTGDKANFIALGDINGDGHVDYTHYYNDSSTSHMIFFGEENGLDGHSFEADLSITSDTGRIAQLVAAGDLNNDGIDDLAIVVDDGNPETSPLIDGSADELFMLWGDTDDLSDAEGLDGEDDNVINLSAASSNPDSDDADNEQGDLAEDNDSNSDDDDDDGVFGGIELAALLGLGGVLLAAFM